MNLVDGFYRTCRDCNSSLLKSVEAGETYRQSCLQNLLCTEAVGSLAVLTNSLEYSIAVTIVMNMCKWCLTLNMNSTAVDVVDSSKRRLSIRISSRRVALLISPTSQIVLPGCCLRDKVVWIIHHGRKPKELGIIYHFS